MRKHLLVLAAYALLALLLTFPLVMQFSTHVVGDGSDDPALTWNLWWFKHALLDLQTSPLSTNFMFYPIGVDLAFYTLTLLNDALVLPLQAAFGLIPAANLMLLASFVLSGYGMFLLATHLLAELLGTGDRPTMALAAFGAGIVYAFSSNKMLYASLGQFNIASSQWLPFYILYLFRLRPEAAAKDIARGICLAALFLLLQAYAEFTFASFLVVFTFLFWLWHIRQRPSFTLLTRRLALVGVLVVAGFAPVLAPMIQELRVEGDFLVQGSGFAEAFSADLIGFLVPSRLNPLLGWLDNRFDFPYLNFVYIGWLTLALALLGGWLYRRHFLARFWGLTTLAFTVIALGPQLRIGGTAYPLPLPFALLQLLPLFKGNRYPSRFSVLITLGIAVLVAFAIQHLLTYIRPSDRFRLGGKLKPSPHYLLFPLLTLMILGEHLSILPLSDYRAPSFYQAIRNDPGDFSVLEVPLDWRNSFRVTGTLDKVFMLSQFYQTIHEKRMLSGNTSRNPELKFQYFTEAPVINSLIALESGHEVDAATLAQDKRYAPDVMRFFGVRYIVLRPQAGDKVRPWLESVLPALTLWREEDGVRVYQLDQQPGFTALNIDPESPLARLYFAEGWGELGEQRVWAEREETRLLLPKPAEDGTLSLRLTVPDDGQSMVALLNGEPIGRLDLQNGTHVYALTIHAAQATEPINDLVLRWSKMLSGNWGNRLNPNAFYPGSVVVKSAGEEVGDFAHIWVNGVDVSPNERGYNVAAIQSASTQVPATYYYDTFDSGDAANQMALQATKYFNVEHSSSGAAIALAVRDEASRMMTAGLSDALQALGVKTKIGWRWSHAFIRYQPLGSENVIVREDASAVRPAIVSIGERITSPSVAGAIESIQFQSSVVGK